MPSTAPTRATLPKTLRLQARSDRRTVASRQRREFLAAGSAGRAAGTKVPTLEEFAGHVADSGEGRWTVEAAIEAGVPVPVLATALFCALQLARRGSEFANRTLSAMRLGFGGHHENRIDGQA